MTEIVRHTPETITDALMRLVANAGNIAKTARDTNISETTIKRWKDDSHAEQYRRLEERYGQQLEAEAVQRARQRLQQADEVMEGLISKAADARDPKDVAANLKSVADAYAKNANAVLQFTGRPVNARESSSSDIVDLFKHMIDRGYLKAAAGVQLETKPTRSLRDSD